MKKLIFGFVLVVSFSSLAAATDYHVRTDGHDTNCDGTANVPDDGAGGVTACAWLTIQKTVNTMATTDTAYVAAGTYLETDGSGYLSFNSGENGKTLTIIGATGNADDVVITGAGGSYDVSINGLTTGTINMRDLKISGAHTTQFLIQDAVTVNLNNVKVINAQASASYAMYVNDVGATVNATNTQAEAYSSAVYMNACSAVTISGGNYTINNTGTTPVIQNSADCDLTINSGATIGSRSVDNEIGILFSNLTTATRDLTIQDSTIYGYDRPIQVGWAEDVVIDNNLIESWTTSSPIPTVMILFATGSYGVPSGPITINTIRITDNTIIGTGITSRTSNNDFGNSHSAYLTSNGYFEFTGNTVTASGGPQIGQYVENVLIRDNTLNINKNAGLILGLDSSSTGNDHPIGNVRVIGNTITASGALTSRGHSILVGMGAGTSTTPTEIAFNQLNGGWYGLVIKGDYVNAHHNSVYGDKSIYLSGSQYSSVTYNSVYCDAKYKAADDNEYCLGLSGNQASEVAVGNIITNNIFVAGTANKVVYDSATSGADNNYINDNIYWSNGTFAYVVKNASTATIEEIQAAWIAEYPNEIFEANDQNSVIADPRLINPTGYNLRIPSGSAANGNKNTINPDLSVWNDKGAWQIKSSGSGSGLRR